MSRSGRGPHRRRGAEPGAGFRVPAAQKKDAASREHNSNDSLKSLQASYQIARITVMTGAGVSAASGVPTFRGADGLWKQFRPERSPLPKRLRRDPKLVWEWYDWRRQAIAACEPNAAHRVLAAWSRRSPHSS